MKTIQKILFFDKAVLILSLLAGLTFIFTLMTSVYTGKIEKTNHALKSQLAEMQSFTEEATGIKGIVESKEKKIGLTRNIGIVSSLEQTLQSLGMKAKVIKPLGKNRVNEYTEEDAELEIQDADLNGIVNLLYKIDNSPVPFKIRNTMIKTAFEDPDKFILKMTVSMISKE